MYIISGTSAWLCPCCDLSHHPAFLHSVTAWAMDDGGLEKSQHMFEHMPTFFLSQFLIFFNNRR